MGLFVVYKHTAPNGKVYIGITGRKPNYRWRDGKGYNQNKHFSSAINKYGWESFAHEIIAHDITKSEACAIEKAMIAKYRSNDPAYGYNGSSGGENPAEGHRHTAETKAKQSAAHIGKPMSDEVKRKISRSKKGKANGREGKVGKEAKQAKIYLQIDPQNGEVVKIWYGAYEIARECGFAKTPVREAAIGKRQTAYGYHWKQVNRGDTDVFV